MDRTEMLAAKAAEIAEMLRPWAMEVLGPGEQLLVSFRVQSLAVVTRDPEDMVTPKSHYLNMGYMEFFSQSRLQEISDTVSGATRVYYCLMNAMYDLRDASGKAEPTLQDFLDKYRVSEILRIPNFGRKSIRLVQRLLESEGLSLQDPTNYLRHIK